MTCMWMIHSFSISIQEGEISRFFPKLLVALLNIELKKLIESIGWFRSQIDECICDSKRYLYRCTSTLPTKPALLKPFLPRQEPSTIVRKRIQLISNDLP
mmetsp:Transcript_6798/g.8591  ORF Transcript_6798/g.8591 Transcript_6798/m.8591 type:complete len:100 (-) Transcript_6798:42-341(-)